MVPFGKDWTLFLDRDGVINKRIPGEYVKNLDEFIFMDGALEALNFLSGLYGKIIVVTNQAGVGKGFMSADELGKIHDFMAKKIAENGGKIDAIYFSPDPSGVVSWTRKPSPGMLFQAKSDWPEIEFSRSVLIGDSMSDLIMAQRAGMLTVHHLGKENEEPFLMDFEADGRVRSLKEFSILLGGIA
jgi:histidinol-phosphate phosphatase family protein